MSQLWPPPYSGLYFNLFAISAHTLVAQINTEHTESSEASTLGFLQKAKGVVGFL